MELMIARITRHRTKRLIAVRATPLVLPITSSARKPTSALSLTGCATETMIAGTTVTKILYTAPSALVRPTASAVPTTAASLPLGIATETLTAGMEATNLQSTASLRAERALGTSLHATMATVFQEFTYVTVRQVLF